MWRWRARSGRAAVDLPWPEPFRDVAGSEDLQKAVLQSWRSDDSPSNRHTKIRTCPRYGSYVMPTKTGKMRSKRTFRNPLHSNGLALHIPAKCRPSPRLTRLQFRLGGGRSRAFGSLHPSGRSAGSSDRDLRNLDELSDPQREPLVRADAEAIGGNQSPSAINNARVISEVTPPNPPAR